MQVSGTLQNPEDSSRTPTLTILRGKIARGYISRSELLWFQAAISRGSAYMGKTYSREAVRQAFARTLRIFRRRVGIAQERLALEAGVDRAYVGNLERGKNSPSLDTILKFTSNLKITFVEFATEFERQLRRRNP